MTTGSIDGKTVLSYRGVVAGEVIFGANFLKDAIADFTDFAGGRSTVYEKVFADARNAALAQLTAQAATLQADAILTVRFNYQVLGERNGMMMVAASGTAVQLVKTDEEKAKDRAHEAAETPIYYPEIAGTEKGPFSLVQLRELFRHGRIEEGTRVRVEGHEGTKPLAAILG